jgi:Transmembrane amino acid transporter protein
MQTTLYLPSLAIKFILALQKGHRMLRGSILLLVALAIKDAAAFAPPQTSQWSRLPLAPTPLQHHPNMASQPNHWKVLTMVAAVAEEGGKADEIPPGQATVTQLCFNLVKGVVGAGVLSLPAGIAAFASAPSAVVPAVALIAVIGALSGYGFALIGRVCAYTNTKSYRDAWSATVGKSTSWLPAVAVTFKTFCAILAYSMILGDTFVSLLTTAGIVTTKVPTLIAVTTGVLLPLCLLKNLASLAPFSLVGSLGMIYTAVAMCKFASLPYFVGLRPQQEW